MQMTIKGAYVQIEDVHGQIISISIVELVVWLHHSGLASCLPTQIPTDTMFCDYETENGQLHK